MGSTALALVAAFLIYFPGRQGSMALTLATGIGMRGLQARVDALQGKARLDGDFSAEDRQFLRNLYMCFAKGARLTVVLRQSSAMMHHYLSCEGTPLRTGSRIFLDSGSVRGEMESLRKQALADLRATSLKTEYRSTDFFMGDATSFDAAVGLYVGRLILHPTADSRGGLQFAWRAEVPWEWPAYGTDSRARASFPIPNALSLLTGRDCALQIEDGLGEYLARLHLARSFLIYAEWSETMDKGSGSRERETGL